MILSPLLFSELSDPDEGDAERRRGESRTGADGRSAQMEERKAQGAARQPGEMELDPTPRFGILCVFFFLRELCASQSFSIHLLSLLGVM